jgi:hypothetical protein
VRWEEEGCLVDFQVRHEGMVDSGEWLHDCLVFELHMRDSQGRDYLRVLHGVAIFVIEVLFFLVVLLGRERLDMREVRFLIVHSINVFSDGLGSCGLLSCSFLLDLISLVSAPIFRMTNAALNSSHKSIQFIRLFLVSNRCRSFGSFLQVGREGKLRKIFFVVFKVFSWLSSTQFKG